MTAGLGAHTTPVAEEAAAVQGVQVAPAQAMAPVQGVTVIQYPRLQAL